MQAKSQVIAMVVLGLSSFAWAGTNTIGTVNAAGDMRVDGYNVNNNATLFDGSVIETARSSATLRLERGITITLAPGSRGTLYRDHFALDKGTSQLEASAPFSLQASGLQITPGQPHSRALVMMTANNTVSIASSAGSFNVSESGTILGSVSAGKSLSFAMTPAAGSGGGKAGGGGGHNWGVIIPVVGIVTAFTIAEIEIHNYPKNPGASR
jgi:hypothetical protein